MRNFSRRNFLTVSLSTLAIACTRRSAAAPRDALVATPHVPLDDHDAAVCAATADNIEGPFYKAGAPHRAVLAGPDEPGERLVVTGVVRSTTTCAPLAGTVLDIWHADARGGYDNAGYHLRGKLVTDAKGRYELHTIVPGRYLNGKRYRPAHIHVKALGLTTQLYFAGDPYNDGDPFIVPSLIMGQVRKGETRFDFALAPA